MGNCGVWDVWGKRNEGVEVAEPFPACKAWLMTGQACARCTDEAIEWRSWHRDAPSPWAEVAI